MKQRNCPDKPMQSGTVAHSHALLDKPHDSALPVGADALYARAKESLWISCMSNPDRGAQNAGLCSRPMRSNHSPFCRADQPPDFARPLRTLMIECATRRLVATLMSAIENWYRVQEKWWSCMTPETDVDADCCHGGTGALLVRHDARSLNLISSTDRHGLRAMRCSLLLGNR